jgi:hypothetical protein
LDKTELVAQLTQQLIELDLLIANTKSMARQVGVDVHVLMTTKGDLVLAPLIVAKANVLAALVALQSN